MADGVPSPQPRRRMSVAYDAIRDTNVEILHTIKEPSDTITDELKAESTISPPEVEAPLEKTKKRRRTPSPQPDRRDDSRADGPRSPKRRRSPESPQHKRSRDGDSKQESRRPPPTNRSRIPPAAYDRRPEPQRPRETDPRRASPPQRNRSRSPDRRRSPPSAYRRRSPPKPRPRSRSPSPIRRSPSREQVRPGGARGRGRNVLAEQQRLAAERERAATANVSSLRNLNVQAASNQFYNTRPEWVKERGRDWRKNESQIKGLRSFNNWIKSCVIQRFSPEEKAEPEELGWGEVAKEPKAQKPLLVLDIGCGKGGDLGKWQLAPQAVGLYVGLDPAATSIQQATERYVQMKRGRRPIFDAEFITKDCFGEWIGEVRIVREVGIDANAGPGANSRWGGGGFDVVTMMFSMHYAFESEERVRMMLRNVAGSLKKGGRFIGVVPNSDALASRIRGWYKKKAANSEDADMNGNGEKIGTTSSAAGPPPNNSKQDPATAPDPSTPDAPSWGNSLYRVSFPSPPIPPYTTVPTGEFRPPFGWKYTYWMAEAVDVPEFVVPWEAFRAIAESFNLEQRYRKPFLDIWEAEKGDPEMGPLAGRMGVIKDGELMINAEEREAVSFYHAFCFVKV
jgi:mRNA (guanine-N7-)-methyltransferase